MGGAQKRLADHPLIALFVIGRYEALVHEKDVQTIPVDLLSPGMSTERRVQAPRSGAARERDGRSAAPFKRCRDRCNDQLRRGRVERLEGWVHVDIGRHEQLPTRAFY